MKPNVVATSECGYAFHLTFCHSANKDCYAQIISGYVPDINLLDYYLKERSIPPVSAILCRPDFQCFNQRTPPHFYSIAWVFLSLRKNSGPTTKAAGSEVLPYVVLCKVRSRCISYENPVSHEQILNQADQNFWAKKLSYLIFFSSEDKFRGHFNLRRIQRVLKCIIEQTDIKLKAQRTVHQKLLFSSFTCLC